MRATPIVWLKRLLLALPLLLLAPALQTRFEFVSIQELGGYVERPAKPEFSWAELKANTYQPALEKYVDDRIGFREWLIRLRNQLSYSLFRTTHADDVIVGHDDVLFGETNIRASLGDDFVGQEETDRRIRRFKLVQDSLAKHNVLLVYVFAPSKAQYFREQMPDYYQHQPRKRSNYTAYSEAMRKVGVNVLDYNQIFQSWKDTVAYPLFPRGGIHWSGYGFRQSGMVLIDYLEQKLGVDLPDYKRTRIEVSDEALDTDADLAHAVNLIWKPAAFRMGYPEIVFAPAKPS
jgi:hypothetical protein